MTDQTKICPQCNGKQYVRGFDMGVEGSHPCDCVTMPKDYLRNPLNEKVQS